MAEPVGTAELSRSIFNPFPGLRAFEPDESYLYFGRGQQTDELMRRLGDTHFLSVVGTSGSGKSSLVKAGLVPALHSGFMADAGSSWRVAITRPGGEPISNLATALADPEVLGEGDETDDTGRAIIETTLRGSSLGLAECVDVARIPEHDNVLIVVDQFEELFRFKQSSRSSDARNEAVAFVKLLLAAAAESGRLYIVITMRSDFIGDCMEFPRLPEAINEGQYLVPRMTRDELRQAITGPVGVRRGKISRRLVARLLNDVGDNPDQLPVLQHALMRMWTLWEGSGRGEALDLVHYREIGSMKEALSRHAEKAFGELASDDQREIAERLFKALTETERGGRGVRRPARLGSICDIAEASLREAVEVIDRFRLEGRSFLMPPMSTELTAETIVDLSHESLMRNWDRLVAWAKEEAAAAAMYRRLSRAAQRHEAGEAGLWRRPELDLGQRWREETCPTAAWARRYDPSFDRAVAFLDESVRVRDELLAQRERARRKKARFKTAFAAISFFILLLGGFLWYLAEKARRLEAVSTALSVDDPLIKAQVLAEIPPDPRERIARYLGETREKAGGLHFETLRRVAHQLIPTAVFRQPPLAGGIESLAVSPDAQWIATVFEKPPTEVQLWRVDGSAQPAIELTGHDRQVVDLSFDPPGDRLVTASEDGTARIWNVREPGSTVILSGHQGGVTSASFSSDGQWVVTTSVDGTARIWSLDGRQVTQLVGHQGTVWSASFSPDGAAVVTASADKTARIWNVGESSTTAVLEGHLADVKSASFSPDSRQIVTAAANDKTARVWNREGILLEKLTGHRNPLMSASFSPDGTKVLTSSADRTARIWNLRRSGPSAGPVVLKGHRQELTAAAFSPDGERAMTASADGQARIWSLEGDELYVLRGQVGGLTAAAFAARAPFLVTAAADGTARVWPTEPGEPQRLGDLEERIAALDDARIATLHLLPNSTEVGAIRVVTTSRLGPVQVWSRGGSGQWSAVELRGHGGGVTSTAFTTDREGTRVVTASIDKTARVWRADGSLIAVLKDGHTDSLTSAAFDRSGTRVVTTSSDKTARIWDSDSGAPLGALEGHALRVTGASFHPDGTSVVTSSFDGTARIWTPDESGKWIVKDKRAKLTHPGREKVLSAAFSADGTRLATSSFDGTARIWALDASGEWHPTELEGHVKAVTKVAFGPRQQEVVTVSKDGTVRVWNAENGAEIYALQVGRELVDAALGNDGSEVLTAEKNGLLKRWRVTESGLRKYLEESTTACLDAEQRRLLLGEWAGTARSRVERCKRRAFGGGADG